MSPEEIINELEELEIIRERMRERNMIYQVGLKEDVAVYNEVPINTYYYIPYIEWDAIRSKYWKESSNG
jgi:hypothetical protein